MDQIVMWLAIACLIIVIALNMILILRAAFTLILKSYNMPIAFTIAYGCWLGLSAVLVIVVITSKRVIGPLFAFGFCIAVLSAMAVVTMEITKLLPKRVHRSGPSARKWLQWRTTRIIEEYSGTFGVITIVVGLVGLWFWRKSIALRMVLNGVGLLGLPSAIQLMRKIESAPSAKVLLNKDHRRPVLYIRPFDLDTDYFTYGAKDVMEKYAPDQVTISSPYFIQLNIEQYLGPLLSNEIGPFIGLGNPRDFSRQGGAARDYEPDVWWKEKFLAHARYAAAIIMQVSCSESLRWEVEQIRKNGWHDKLFIVQKPVADHHSGVKKWMFEALSGPVISNATVGTNS